MENKYNYIGKGLKTQTNYGAYFKGLFGGMWKYAKLAFGKNLFENLEKLKKENLESKLA